MNRLQHAAVLSLVLLTASWAGFAHADGKELYQRCAACHLPDGAGIPGSFPPLKNRIRPLLAEELGRAYLVNVINVGLIGPISIGGTAYMGVMPAQGSSYSAAEISELINFMAQELDDSPSGEGWRQFGEVEVQSILEASSAKGGHDVARARAELMAAHPKLL